MRKLMKVRRKRKVMDMRKTTKTRNMRNTRKGRWLTKRRKRRNFSAPSSKQMLKKPLASSRAASTPWLHTTLKLVIARANFHVVRCDPRVSAANQRYNQWCRNFPKDWRLACAYAGGKTTAALESNVASISFFLLKSTLEYGSVTH